MMKQVHNGEGIWQLARLLLPLSLRELSRNVRESQSMGCFKSFLKAARFSCLSIAIRSAKSLVGLQTNTGFHGN